MAFFAKTQSSFCGNRVVDCMRLKTIVKASNG